ncbi:MAG: hypothetical protein C0445_11180 [Polaromonas sp.]|nr:hypothetical protein [Polaromonas sp.]
MIPGWGERFVPLISIIEGDVLRCSRGSTDGQTSGLGKQALETQQTQTNSRSNSAPRGRADGAAMAHLLHFGIRDHLGGAGALTARA